MEVEPTGVGIAEQNFNLFMSLDTEGQDAMLRDMDRSVAEIRSIDAPPLGGLAPNEKMTVPSSFQPVTAPREENRKRSERVEPITGCIYHNAAPTAVPVQQTSEGREFSPLPSSSSSLGPNVINTGPIYNDNDSCESLYENEGPAEDRYSDRVRDWAFEHDGGIYSRSQATSCDQQLRVSRPPQATPSMQDHLPRAPNDCAADEDHATSEFLEHATAELRAHDMQPWVATQIMAPVETAERVLQFLAPFVPPADPSLPFKPRSSMIVSSAEPNITMPSARVPFANSLGANIPVAGAGRNSEAGPNRTETGSVNEAPYDVETYTCLLRNCKQFNKSFKSKKDFWRHVRSTQGHKGQVGSAAGPKCSTCGEVFSWDDSLGRHIRTIHGGSAVPSP